MTDTVRRVVRSLLQFVAGGGLTALVAAATDGLAPETATILTIAFGTLVSALQNVLEDKGVITDTRG